MVGRAKKDLNEAKHPPTGGGPREHEGQYTQHVIDILGKESPKLFGVSGGLESGEEAMRQGEVRAQHMTFCNFHIIIILLIKGNLKPSCTYNPRASYLV